MALEWIDYGPIQLARTGKYDRSFIGSRLMSGEKQLANIIRVLSGPESRHRLELERDKPLIEARYGQ